MNKWEVYDDTIVRVVNPRGEVGYEGIYDYNPYSHEPWAFDFYLGYYILETIHGTYRLEMI